MRPWGLLREPIPEQAQALIKKYDLPPLDPWCCSVRAHVAHRWSFAVPDPGALARLARYAPLVEIGAGRATGRGCSPRRAWISAPLTSSRRDVAAIPTTLVRRSTFPSSAAIAALPHASQSVPCFCAGRPTRAAWPPIRSRPHRGDRNLCWRSRLRLYRRCRLSPPPGAGLAGSEKLRPAAMGRHSRRSDRVSPALQATPGHSRARRRALQVMPGHSRAFRVWLISYSVWEAGV